MATRNESSVDENSQASSQTTIDVTNIGVQKPSDGQKETQQSDFCHNLAKEPSKAEPSTETSVEQAGRFWTRYRGILYGIAAALLFSWSALLVKVIAYHPYNLGVWRFTSMIMITIPILIYGHYSRMKKNNVQKPSDGATQKNYGIFQEIWPINKTAGCLILQAILGSNSIMLVFFGLRYLNIGDSIVIGTSTPVFVTFVAWIVLREQIGYVSVGTAVVAVLGVAIICKPPILTGNTELNPETLKGVLFSLASMTLLTFCYVLVRYLRKVHHALVQFTFAIWGLIESVILAYFFQVLEIPNCWKDVILIFLNAILALAALTCLTLALKYEQAGLTSLVRTTEVIFCYVWQILLLHIEPDKFR